MDTDDLRIRRWGTIGEGYLGPAFHMRFKPGHVLYGSRRTYLRKVAVADFEGITANTTFVIEPKDPKALAGVTAATSCRPAASMSTRSGVKGLSQPKHQFSDLLWYDFPCLRWKNSGGSHDCCAAAVMLCLNAYKRLLPLQARYTAQLVLDSSLVRNSEGIDPPD